MIHNLAVAVLYIAGWLFTTLILSGLIYDGNEEKAIATLIVSALLSTVLWLIVWGLNHV